MNNAGTGPQPAGLSDVRAMNLAVVLRHVRSAGPCSRADIATSTGLSNATVSSIVARLIERRVLREIGYTGHRVGRPAIMLALDGAGYVGIGIVVGVDHLTAVALDVAGRQVLKWRRSFCVPGTHPGRVIAEVAGLAQRATARVRDAGGTLLGLTIAVPGLVDTTGTVRTAPALGWADVELRAGLERALRRPEHPVVIDNDAMLGALAEYRYGPHAGTAHLAYIAGHPGGGVGVVTGGLPLRGANGYGGALGHIRVDSSGPKCACGRSGCVEAVAGLETLLTRAGIDPRDVVARDDEVKQLAQRFRDGEARALSALTEVGAGIGYAVALLVNLLNPTVILLGGHYAALGRWLLPVVEREFRPLAAAPDAGGVQLVASTLGYEAAALGGAAVALDKIVSILIDPK